MSRCPFSSLSVSSSLYAFFLSFFHTELLISETQTHQVGLVRSSPPQHNLEALHRPSVGLQTTLRSVLFFGPASQNARSEFVQTCKYKELVMFSNYKHSYGAHLGLICPLFEDKRVFKKAKYFIYPELYCQPLF